MYFIRLTVKGRTVLYRTFQLMYLHPATDDSRKEIPKDVVGKYQQTDYNILVLCLCGSEC